MKSFWSEERNVWSSAMLQKRYKIVYADPPWKLGDNDETSLVRHRKLLNAIDLASLPVWELVDDDAFLVMWWPSNMPLEALQVMKEWGFRLYKMNGFTWIRQGRVRADAEICLFAVRGNGIEYIRDWQVPGVIHAQSRKVGEKPLETKLLLDRLVPAHPKLELFTDSGRDNWDSWQPDSNRMLN